MVSTAQIIGQSPASAESPATDTVPPAPKLPVDVVEAAAKPWPALDPTRYGDWEKNGRCIDF
jgi:hypothetical protein